MDSLLSSSKKGVVANYNKIAGFGVIKSDSDDEIIFVHHAEIVGNNSLKFGQTVEYTPAVKYFTKQAVFVKVLAEPHIDIKEVSKPPQVFLSVDDVGVSSVVLGSVSRNREDDEYTYVNDSQQPVYIRSSPGVHGLVCKRCGGKRHVARVCTTSERAVKATSRTCFNCGGFGHISDYCASPKCCKKCGGIDHSDRRCKSVKTDNSVCFNCGGSGHLGNLCATPSARKCHNCGGIGHIAAKCNSPPVVKTNVGNSGFRGPSGQMGSYPNSGNSGNSGFGGPLGQMGRYPNSGNSGNSGFGGPAGQMGRSGHLHSK